MSDLRSRIAYAIAQADGDLPGMEPDSWDYVLADAVIRELDLGIPCATNGCRMRQLTRRHAEKSGGLTDSGDAK